MIAETETFWTLLHNGAHWQFEIFLMILFDGLLAGIMWPLIKRAVRRHDEKKHNKEHDHWDCLKGSSDDAL